MTNIVEALNADPMPADASAKQMIQWSENLVQQIEPQVNTLSDSVKSLGEQWDIFSNTMREYKRMVMQMPNNDAKQSLQEQRNESLQFIVLSLSISGSIRKQLDLMQMIGNIIFALRPMSLTFENTINLVDSIRTTSQELLDVE